MLFMETISTPREFFGFVVNARHKNVSHFIDAAVDGGGPGFFVGPLCLALLGRHGAMLPLRSFPN